MNVKSNSYPRAGVGASLPAGGLFASATVDAANTLLKAIQTSGCPVDSTTVTNFQAAYKADPNATTFPAITGFYDSDTQVALADALGKLTQGNPILVDSSIPQACDVTMNLTQLPPPGSASSSSVTPVSATTPGALSANTTLMIVGGVALVTAVGTFLYLKSGRSAAHAPAMLPSSRRSAPRRRRRR